MKYYECTGCVSGPCYRHGLQRSFSCSCPKACLWKRCFDWQKWTTWVACVIALIALWFRVGGCVQHELKYDYYLKDPNSLHVESLHYKQNTLAMKTDKLMTEAVFADVISLKMDKSTQIPDPNVIKATGEAAGKLIKEVVPLIGQQGSHGRFLQSIRKQEDRDIRGLLSPCEPSIHIENLYEEKRTPCFYCGLYHDRGKCEGVSESERLTEHEKY